MRDSEMIGAHFGLQKVGFRNHSVDIDLHYFLNKCFVVQCSLICVLIEEHLHLVFFEIAAKFI